MNIKIDLSFPHDYEVDTNAELPGCPGSIKTIYYPEAAEVASHGGLLVKVLPKCSDPWIGIFGDLDPHYWAGIMSCPDRNSVCVVSWGEGYLVRADNPMVFESIQPGPIIDAHAIVDAGLIVFADFTKLVAYGREGMRWVTERLAYDGVRITETTPEHICGMAYHAPSAKEIEFIVDTRTGRHRGGAYL